MSRMSRTANGERLSEKIASYFTRAEKDAVMEKAEREQRSAAWIIRRAVLKDLGVSK